MNKRRRLKNGFLFGAVLISSMIGVTLSSKILLEFLPRLWNWPLEYLAQEKIGRTQWQSAFGGIAMIVGSLGGLWTASFLDRGKEDTIRLPLFVWLLMMGLIAELLFYGLLKFMPTPSPPILHGGVFLIWAAFSYLRIRRITKTEKL